MRMPLFISLFLVWLPSSAVAQYEMPRISYSPAYSPQSISHTILPLPLLKPSIPFYLPDTELFVSYNHYQQQGGITVPLQSVNSSRMLVNNSGYMNLYNRENFGIGLTGTRRMYPSLGVSNSVALGAGYSPTDWISFYGNAYASDNMIHETRFKDLGISGAVRIKVADRLYINGFGQYSVITTNSTHPLPGMGMFPGTNYGGSVEFKVSDKFGIQGVVNREYNAFTRKWETSYYVLPVFY